MIGVGESRVSDSIDESVRFVVAVNVRICSIGPQNLSTICIEGRIVYLYCL